MTTINHPSDLNSLNSFPAARRRGLGQLKLSDSFQHEEREKLEKDLNKYYYACGCDTGAKMLIAGLVAGTLYNLIPYFEQTTDLSTFLTTIFITGIGGAIIGKVTGLTKANFKLKRTIHTIQALWRPKDKPVKEIILCG